MTGPVVSPAVSLRHQLLAAWSAPIFTVMTVVGWFWLAHFYDPAAASLSPEATRDFFVVEHRFGILLGCSIFLASCAFLTLWSVQLGLMLGRLEGSSPLMAVTQVLGGVSIAVIVVINCSLWIGAAYRPDADPDVIVALNDAAWLGFLIAWPILSMQMLAAAAVALHDRRPQPLFPRWVSWASVAGAVLLATAAGPAFTQTGPFAFDGALGLYLPIAIWAVWLDGHAWYMRRAIRAQQRELAAAAELEHVPERSEAESVPVAVR